MRTDASKRTWVVRSPADLGRAIAGIRAERGLTQADLAEQVVVDRSYLARIEAGSTTLVLDRALRALRRLGATVTVTITERDGPQG